MSPQEDPSYYEVLDLPSSLRNDGPISVQTLRAAYRRALLRWHPDKSNTKVETAVKSFSSSNQATFSVDQISIAYATLADSKRRAEYDRELTVRIKTGANTSRNTWEQKFKTGVEVVDLDDLEYDEAHGIWYRGCRCGDWRGFEVREEGLEDGQADGEVIVGCKGCSLWLRVLFGVVEDVAGEKTNTIQGD